MLIPAMVVLDSNFVESTRFYQAMLELFIFVMYSQALTATSELTVRQFISAFYMTKTDELNEVNSQFFTDLFNIHQFWHQTSAIKEGNLIWVHPNNKIALEGFYDTTAQTFLTENLPPIQKQRIQKIVDRMMASPLLDRSDNVEEINTFMGDFFMLFDDKGEFIKV